MNQYHKQLMEQLDNLNEAEIRKLARKAIDDYSLGYKDGIKNNDIAKADYFKNNIQIVDGIVRSCG